MAIKLKKFIMNICNWGINKQIIKAFPPNAATSAILALRARGVPFTPTPFIFTPMRSRSEFIRGDRMPESDPGFGKWNAEQDVLYQEHLVKEEISSRASHARREYFCRTGMRAPRLEPFIEDQSGNVNRNADPGTGEAVASRERRMVKESGSRSGSTLIPPQEVVLRGNSRSRTEVKMPLTLTTKTPRSSDAFSSAESRASLCSSVSSPPRDEPGQVLGSVCNGGKECLLKGIDEVELHKINSKKRTRYLELLEEPSSADEVAEKAEIRRAKKGQARSDRRKRKKERAPIEPTASVQSHQPVISPENSRREAAKQRAQQSGSICNGGNGSQLMDSEDEASNNMTMSSFHVVGNDQRLVIAMSISSATTTNPMSGTGKNSDTNTERAVDAPSNSKHQVPLQGIEEQETGIQSNVTLTGIQGVIDGMNIQALSAAFRRSSTGGNDHG
jgi:hypothetical protein